MAMRYRDRTEAGKLLAKRLAAYAHRPDVIVVALPRGGVPVAFEVAQALCAPLDVCIVRKLGVPHHEELAMGAIAAGGIRILNYDVINSLGISNKTIDEVTAKELQKLQRRNQIYRGDRPPLNVQNRTVILIDDGIATGSTIRAAIAVLRQQQPRKIVVATPVAPPAVCAQLQAEVDEVVCLQTPEPLYAIGLWYENFSQTTDEQVRELLAKQVVARNLQQSAQ